MNSRRAILIAGPTASGKSQVALHVAKALGGVIINADSMQVYEGLDILTAKPDKKTRALVPHLLYGVKKPDSASSVAEWLELSRHAAESTWTSDNVAIFTGGTGLYFKALTIGLVDIPEIPEKVRATLRLKMETEGVEKLYQTLQEIDPEITRRLEAKDKQRILRALEVYEGTGKPLSVWQKTPTQSFLDEGKTLKICLEAGREELERRIRQRFEKMFAEGVLEEVKTFTAQNFSPDLPFMKTIGLRPLIRHLEGEITLEQATDLTVIESRQYAKRQRTWFNNQFADWDFVTAGEDAAGKIVSLAGDAFRD